MKGNYTLFFVSIEVLYGNWYKFFNAGIKGIVYFNDAYNMANR